MYKERTNKYVVYIEVTDNGHFGVLSPFDPSESILVVEVSRVLINPLVVSSYFSLNVVPHYFFIEIDRHFCNTLMFSHPGIGSPCLC